MKREGRQHGMVRSYPIIDPRPESRYRFDSPPTAGVFTKVSSKPTNHSKFTGVCGRPKCAGCHTHPVSKSRPKAKGNHKLRSFDVVSNHRLVSWRVVDSDMKLSGFSTGAVLDHLDRDLGDYYDDWEGEFYEDPCELDHLGSEELEVASGAVDVKDCDVECKYDDENDLEIVGADADEDEDWCLVEEM